MTITEIQNGLAKAGKSVSPASVYVYLSKLEIKPVGAKQRPQPYPADSLARILKHLGLAEANGWLGPFSDKDTAAGRLASMPELRRDRARAAAPKKGRGK